MDLLILVFILGFGLGAFFAALALALVNANREP